MKLIKEFALTADQPCQVKRWLVEDTDVGSVIQGIGALKSDVYLLGRHVGQMVDESTYPDGTVDKGFLFLKNSKGQS